MYSLGLQSRWGLFRIQRELSCKTKGYFLFFMVYLTGIVLSQTQLQSLKVESLHDGVWKCFVDGKPPHLLEGNFSYLNILTDRDWSEMSSKQSQETITKGPVLIKSCELKASFSFDLELFFDMLGHGNMKYVVLMEGKEFSSLEELF
jgi:hypothetical protein